MKAQHREGNLLAIALIAGLCLSTLTALRGIDYGTHQKGEPETQPTATSNLSAPAALAGIGDSVKKSNKVAPVVAANPVWAATPTPVAAPLPAWSGTPTLPLAGLPPLPPVDAVLSLDAPATFALAPLAAALSYPAFSFGFSEDDTLGLDSLSEVSLVDYQRHVAEMAREMAQMQEGMAREMEKMAREMASVDGEMARHHSELAKEMAENQREMAEEMAQMNEEIAREQARMAIEMATAHREEVMRQQADMRRHQAEMQAHEKEMREEHEKEMRKMEEQMREHEKRMDAFEKDFKAELIRDGIISSADKQLKVKINERELLINDAKQSDAVYKKYKKFIMDKLGQSFDFDDEGDHEMNLSFTF